MLRVYGICNISELTTDVENSRNEAALFAVDSDNLTWLRITKPSLINESLTKAFSPLLKEVS